MTAKPKFQTLLQLADKLQLPDTIAARARCWQAAFGTSQTETVALYQRDSREFAAMLLGLWRAGKSALLPGDNRTDTQRQLERQGCAFAGEFERDDLITATGNPNNRDTACATLAPERQALIIFTSGSSGEPEPIGKSFAQLQAEINSLERLWGQALDDCTITGTVSHQHIYGLLFRLLWPLCAGRHFVTCARDYSESLQADCRKYGRIAVISSPAHLSRLPSELNSALLQQNCCALFSSGAPLSLSAAQHCADVFGRDPIEVYGSSETGGIAHRQQRQNPLWQPLPEVEVRAELRADETLLAVRSPHLASRDWFVSADRIESLDNQRFLLAGRSDRIVKVGGKRVSLCAIERRLLEHPWVEQVKTLQLQDRQMRTAAVIVLSGEGNNRLIDTDKTRVCGELKQWLEGHTERVAIPRYWRFWDSIPCNSQSKSTQRELAALFASSKPNLPQVQQCTGEGFERQLEIFIPHNLSYFDGHFPGRPVLPGVVQTDWAIHYACELFGELGHFSGLEVIKFQQVITPGKILNLQLSWKPERGKLSFSYRLGDKNLSSGRAVFAPSEASCA